MHLPGMALNPVRYEIDTHLTFWKGRGGKGVEFEIERALPQVRVVPIWDAPSSALKFL